MNRNELNALRDSLLAEIKQMMLTTGQVTQYIGARYVPVFANPIDWDEEREYEPLTVVMYQGDSYTSRQFVPKGIRIADAHYWALTGNYNAQIEQYREEVRAFDVRITTAQNTADTKAPINHAAEETIYGVGNEVNYGHVKLTDSASVSDSNSGVAATPKMVSESVKFNMGYIACNIVNHVLIVSYSNDLVNFNEINRFNETNDNDWVTLLKHDDMYFIFSNYGYYTTEDFKTFNYHALGINAWGGTIIEDKYISSENYSGKKRRLYAYDITFDGDTVNLSNKQPVVTPNFIDGTSYVIDPSAIYHNGMYYLAFKDEETLTVKVYSYSTFDNLMNGTYIKQGKTDFYSYIEGPKLFTDGDKVNCMVSFYDMRAYLNKISTNIKYIINDKNLPLILCDIFGTNPYIVQCNIDKNRHIDFIEANNTVAKNNKLVSKPLPDYWSQIEIGLNNGTTNGNLFNNIIIALFQGNTIICENAVINNFNVLVNTDKNEYSFKVNGSFASNIKNVELYKFKEDNDYSVPAGSLIKFINMSGVFFKEN